MVLHHVLHEFRVLDVIYFGFYFELLGKLLISLLHIEYLCILTLTILHLRPIQVLHKLYSGNHYLSACHMHFVVLIFGFHNGVASASEDFDLLELVQLVKGFPVVYQVIIYCYHVQILKARLIID